MAKPSTSNILRFPSKSNGDRPQPPDSATILTAKRITSMLDCTKDALVFAWLQGSSEMRLAKAYQVPRPAVESIVRERVRRMLNRRMVKAVAA